jgi:hypothetical protein
LISQPLDSGLLLQGLQVGGLMGGQCLRGHGAVARE